MLGTDTWQNRGVNGNGDPAELIGGLVTRCLEDVQAEEIAWLWLHRFALGKLSLIGGIPGAGKSWLSLYITAAISRARPWPDGRGNAPLGSALIANAEDGVADTIKVRLVKMGADCRRIHVLDCVRLPGEGGKLIEHGFTLAHVAALEAELKRLGDVRAIIIDPVSAHLAEADEHRNGEIRALLKPLSKLAEKYAVAIILITHLTKNGSANSVHRMIGSIGFAGAARSVWMVAKDPKDPKRRLLLLAKCNIAPDEGGLAYSIVDGCIAWEAGTVNESADDVLAAENRDNDAGDDGNDNDTWLRAELADFAEHPVADLRKAVNEAGLNWRNIQRAASRLKVRRERSGFGGSFIWRLPKPAQPPENVNSPIRATLARMQNKGTNGTNGTNGKREEEEGF